MKLALVRACTRSACFELQNNTCYTAPAPFRVQLNGQTVLEACGTNVFSVFSLEPGKTYHLEVLATDGDTGTLDFATAAESFFVDASRYGLVNDGVTDNTAFLQAALSTCPPGGTVYVPAGTYRTQSLFLGSTPGRMGYSRRSVPPSRVQPFSRYRVVLLHKNRLWVR